MPPTRQPFASLIAQVGLYIAVTAAMGIPYCSWHPYSSAASQNSKPAALKNLISATTLHLVWSTGMAFLLPLIIN